ncbi:hypothetical protein FIU85_13150 [Roseovarius sp. THAF8]|uniref:DUF2252 domain-containing protein n=1 Tax=Roseovarius sp. THAF8 TaxID=2587846 RepID=UPI0012678605|nr:DUF2252 family protein [Roseovarius sp. THAF8]QFT98253.1 hypothetical protein FIU85_13150 [Roseovarius sp. THAF8]
MAKAKSEKSGKSNKVEPPDPPEKSIDARYERRSKAFGRLSAAIAEGKYLVPPKFLQGQARRLHVRTTIREDHAARITESSKGARDKFEKLAGCPYKFFRGTALLFYRDMVGEDGHMPTVMALGDVHPANFGVMPDKNGAPIFGVNDFDETTYAPFSWDIKRGAVGFWIAALTEGELKPKQARKIIRKFVRGYATAMQDYANKSTERNDAYRTDNSPKVIRRLFEQAWEERRDWLWDDYLTPNGRAFRSNDELQPLSTEIDKFQKAINDLAKSNGIDAPDRAGELKVKDVCVRHGQGTASLGLPRYYVLIEGPSQDATDDLIIEFKAARRSALDGLVPPNAFYAGEQAERIRHGQRVQLAHGDIFYGAVEIDGKSFMSRERAPFRDDIDLDDLSYRTWKKYAKVCGAALAQAHALSDDLGRIDYDVEPSIMEAIAPLDLFVGDIVRFTEEAVARLQRDHAFFREDHKLGAFDSLDVVFR